MDVSQIEITKQSSLINGVYNVFPSQPPVVSSLHPEPMQFVQPDPQYYLSAELFPKNPAEVVGYGYFDGNARIVTIAYYPIQYNPLEHVLNINNSITICLSFTPSTTMAPIFVQQRSILVQSNYDFRLENLVANFSEIAQHYIRPNLVDRNTVDYIIVGPNEYLPYLIEFKKWKERKGLKVVIQSIEGILTQYTGDSIGNINDDAGKLRQYLREQYQMFGFAYLLLIGNEDNMPVRIGQPTVEIMTDFYYTEFNGNWDSNDNQVFGEIPTYTGNELVNGDAVDLEQEIYCGRLLIPPGIHNANQLITNWIDKVITYETNPGWGEYDYLHNIYYARSDHFALANMNSTYSHLLSHGFTVVHDEEANPLEEGFLDHSLSGNHVISMISQGTGFFALHGHGAPKFIITASTGDRQQPLYLVTSRNNYDFGGIDENANGFDNITQNGKYNIGYMAGCSCGNYQNATSANNSCFPYVFNLEAACGGPDLIAYTTHSWVGLTELLNSAYISAFLQAVNETDFITPGNNVGIVLANSKSWMSPNGFQTYEVFYGLSLFGDPELQMWQTLPQVLSVDYSSNNNALTVFSNNNPISGALVHMFNDDLTESFIAYTDTNGQVIIDANLHNICVRKHNYLPIIQHIVTQNEVVNNREFEYDVLVPSNRTLTLHGHIQLSCLVKNRNARIIVEDGASLYIDNATIIGNVASYDQVEGNAIIVYGDLEIGDNVVFSSVGGLNWDGLIIDNHTNSTLNNATFSRCNLRKLYGSIEATGITLNHGRFISSDATVSIRNSNITGSIDISNSNETSLTGITVNNLFSGSPAIKIYDTPQLQIENVNVSGAGNGLEMQNCRDYSITNSSFSNNSGNGISIYETNGIYSYTISDCEIRNNLGVGVRFYNSIGNLIGCMIANNNKGVTAYRVSNLKIASNPGYQDSYIGNNDLQEILFVDSANIFIDGERNMIVDNAYNPLTYDKYLIHCPNLQSSRHMRLNFWGYRNQYDMAIMPPESRFYPECVEPEAGAGYYIDPVWNPGITIVDDDDMERVVFHSAIDAALDENPSLAISLFKQLISEFPGSEFAAASAKHIYALEDDKLALKDYYSTEPNLHYNGEIDKVVDYLSTHCNIVLGNYQEAIAWFEDVISNPPSELDSLMAVIDLGYAYTLMQGDAKTSVIAKYPHLKPKSLLEFEANRESILSNLYTSVENPYGAESNESSIVAVVPVLEKNYPNPFNPSTTISFSIPSDMSCKLDVYNIRGQKVKTLLNENMIAGRHLIVWDGVDDNGRSVSSGVYFYRLATPNRSQTYKMLMIK